MQSQQMAAATAMKKIEMETQSKIQVVQAEASFDIEKRKRSSIKSSS